MEPSIPNSNPLPLGNPNNSLKSRFATRFLKALAKINNLHNPLASSSPREILRRRRRIKLAADHSMARSVRSRRAWKRAVLSNTRIRARLSSTRASSVKTRKIKTSQQLRKPSTTNAICGEAEELKKLVPGGEAMNLESLLEETTHYIKCLSAQVQVMTAILDSCSTTSIN